MKRIDKVAGWVTLLALSALSLHAEEASPRAAGNSVTILDALPLLFADESGVACKTGMTRTIHPARTSLQPVLSPDRPWEGCRVYASGSAYAAEDGEGYRLWYSSADGMLFATSKDGVHWRKPELGICDHEGSTSNNIVFKGIACPSVLWDRQTPDPAKRYKLVFSRVHKGYHSATSPDGLYWTELTAPIFMYHDTITLAQDPRTHDYLAYHKRHWDLRGINRRIVWLSRSTDFQNWSDPALVFAPDEEDDTWATAPRQRTEVYNMSVLAHATGFLGFPTMFWVSGDLDAKKVQTQQSPTDGAINVQLVTSTDGTVWQRTSPRVTVIPNGPAGAFDAGCILNVSSTAITTDDETWLYYTGVNTKHGGTMPPKRMSLGRAVWRRHGFASLDATGKGRLETKPVRLATPALEINADASRGVLRVGVTEADGTPIKGLSIAECEPLQADATRHALRWTSGAKPPADRPVRLTIELERGRLYSIECRYKQTFRWFGRKTNTGESNERIR